jgi:hypothetical protein
MTRYACLGALLALFSASAAFPQITFTFTSFDPPGSLETHAYAVNNRGNVTGYYLNSTSGLFVGYERLSNGQFSKPIGMPGDNLYATGLNDSNVISGYYYTTETEISFTYSKGVFTDFAYNDLQTQVDRINNNGDLTGIYEESASLFPGFVYVASSGATATFSVAGGAATFPEGLNKKDIVVGAYTPTIPYSTFQSFLRLPNGKIVRFSYPGASQTFANQINDCNVIAGSFDDASGMQHGFYGKLTSFTEIDYPGAVQTSLDGINNKGELVGSYIDSSSFRHGFVAIPSMASCTL